MGVRWGSPRESVVGSQVATNRRGGGEAHYRDAYGRTGHGYQRGGEQALLGRGNRDDKAQEGQYSRRTATARPHRRAGGRDNRRVAIGGPPGERAPYRARDARCRRHRGLPPREVHPDTGGG